MKEFQEFFGERILQEGFSYRCRPIGSQQLIEFRSSTPDDYSDRSGGHRLQISAMDRTKEQLEKKQDSKF